MTQPNAGRPNLLKEGKVRSRDWVLLPLLSLLTIVLIVVSTEVVARRAFGTSKTTIDSCLVSNDAANGVAGIPNSVCWEKIAESPLVEYKFDCSGYRTGMDCRPKAPGRYRIVLIGSSVAMGQKVPMEKTVASLLPKELSRRVGRPVDVYNYAMAFGFPRNTALRFNDVLAAKPDLILWILTAVDVKLADFSYAEYLQQPEPPSSPSFLSSLRNRIRDKVREHGGNPFTASLAGLRHFLLQYQSQRQYVQSYLTIANGNEGPWDAGPGALQAELTQEWEARLRKFQTYVEQVGKMSRNEGVPIVAVMVPNRAQAALISMEEWPQGIDPFRLDRELRLITTSQGGTYIDILPYFRATPNPERHYYPLDGHLDGDGHAIIAEFLAKELSGGAVPELKAAVQSDDALRKGR
jgi:hypothetical protein